jgi:GTPase
MAALLDERESRDVNGELELPDRFPPEPQNGAMEYKLHLVEPSDARVEHLTTQMKWRVEEGEGEAVYRLGVKDSGEILGLEPQALEKSLHTMTRMADKIGASVKVVRRYRCKGGGREVVEVVVQEGGGSSQCAHYLEPCVAVLGPVEAGKSTLLGVLMDGQLDNGRGQARLNLLRHRHELVSGRTSSISRGFLGFTKAGEVVNYENCGSIQEICEASSKLVTLIDLAGHRKYLKTTVFGLTAYEPQLAMLVVGTDTKIGKSCKN